MKRIFIMAIGCPLLAIGINASAQVDDDTSMLKPLYSSTVATPATVYDVSRISSNAMSTITPALKLSDKQIPQINSAVTSFFNEKAKIMPWRTSNKTAYDTKQSSLSSSFQQQLSKVLNNKQMKKFESLKPPVHDPANVISNLFY